MIVGVGVDLVSVPRVGVMLSRHGERALARLFTRAEMEYCRGRRAPDESYAARFAAKEAFFKALGTGWGRGGGWTDVSVTADTAGAPSIEVAGRALDAARARGVQRIHVSLSHAADLAFAYVVLEA